MQYQSFVAGSGISGATGPTGATGVVVPWTRITTTATLSANTQYIADTSGGPFTATLPGTPATGTVIVLQDGNDWGANNLTLARNGSTIEGQADNLALNLKNSLVWIIYDGLTWQVSSSAGPQGATGPTGATGATGPTGPSGAAGATGTFPTTSSSALAISNTTISTSNTTGALTVTGGVGVTGNVWVDTVVVTNGLILNSNTINRSYTVPDNYNAGSFGPITVANTAVVTVPSGSIWTVV